MTWESTYVYVRCSMCGQVVYCDKPLQTAEQHEREHHQGRITCVLGYSRHPPTETYSSKTPMETAER